MTQDYKRIVKNTLFLYFRMIIIIVVNFYTVRIVLDTLGVNDFGLYNLIAGFVIIIAFLNDSLTSGTQRFLTFEIGKNDLKKVGQIFSTAMLIHIALSIFILIIGETIGLWFLYEKMNIPLGRSDVAFWVYQFALFSTMITIMQAPYNSLIIAHERMNIFAYIAILEAVLKLFIVYLLLISSYDKLIIYAILMFLVSVFIAFIYKTYVVKNYQESHFKLSFDKDIVKSMIHFSGWNIFGILGSLFCVEGINIILNIFFGPIAVAARSISMQVSSGLSKFTNGFQQAVTPQITKLYATGQLNEMNKLLYQNSKYAFLLLWFLALPTLMQIEYILNLWLIEVPENTVIFCQIIIIHALIISLDRPFVMAFHATGNMKQMGITVGVVLLLVLPISYFLLYNGFSIIMPLIIYIIATILSFMIELYYLKKWINISIIELFKNTLIPVIVIVIISTILVYNIVDIYKNSLINFSMIIIYSMSINLILTYTIALDKYERTKLKMFVQNKFKRK